MWLPPSPFVEKFPGFPFESRLPHQTTPIFRFHHLRCNLACNILVQLCVNDIVGVVKRGLFVIKWGQTHPLGEASLPTSMRSTFFSTGLHRSAEVISLTKAMAPVM